MAENKIPKRSEVPEELTWNLGDMFESDEVQRERGPEGDARAHCRLPGQAGRERGDAALLLPSGG